MLNFVAYIISLALIFFAFLELRELYRVHIKKQKVNKLLNPVADTESRLKKQKDIKKESSFEKMVTKGNNVAYFWKQLENNHLWKVAAVITIFFVFIVVNGIFNLVDLDQQIILIILLVALLVVIFVPGRVRTSMLNKKVRKLANDVPLLVDMLAVMIQSGMTVEGGLRFVKDKFVPINPDMASVLDRACLKMDINGINSALTLIYEEVPCREVKMLCSTLQQSVNYGSSIYSTLLSLSGEIRETQILETEEKIAAASAKMTLPMMLFILLPVLVIVVGPIVVNFVRMF